MNIKEIIKERRKALNVAILVLIIISFTYITRDIEGSSTTAIAAIIGLAFGLGYSRK